MKPGNHKPKKLHLISLGCARNQVDSEVMLGTMFGAGWEHTNEPRQADAIVVNTCGFIQSAKEESIDHILQSASYKKENPNLKLVVAGCLTQRYKHQLAKGLPEVDLFIGTDEFTRLAELLSEPTQEQRVHAKRTNYLYSESMPRVNTLSKESAYVKVAEGCQHNCAFCIIPAIRGRLRSRSISSVVSEVENLVAAGVVEVNLIAQDLAAYGRDSGEDRLLPLLRELVKVEGLRWVRLLYVYPENISDEFLQFMRDEEKILNYMDIPVQHASDRILEKMNRGVTQNQLRAIFKKARAVVPGLVIRTSVMVGFPSETEEDFQQLSSFIKEMAFDHLGCFTYSKEEGTAAGRMDQQISQDVMDQRRDQIMAVQKELSREKLQRYVGKQLPVLVSGPSKDSDLVWEGRLAIQAPDVDGVVYLTDGPVKAGAIQMVRISEAHDYDLVGAVCE